MFPTRGYLGRIPTVIRLALTGHQNSWGGSGSVEFSIKGGHMASANIHRYEIVDSGSLGLIKYFYAKQNTALDPAKFQYYYEIKRAIYFGNIKIFWYLYDFSRIGSTGATDVFIPKYILHPMIRMGLSSWISCYTKRRPYIPFPDDRNELIIFAMWRLHTNVMIELLNAGSSITSRAVKEAEYLLKQRTRLWGYNNKEVMENLVYFRHTMRGFALHFKAYRRHHHWKNIQGLLEAFGLNESKGMRVDIIDE